MPFLAFLTGPLGKLAGIGLLIVSLFAAGAYALHEHDSRVLAEAAAQQQAKTITEMQQQMQRNDAALENATKSAASISARNTNLREAVDAAPHTTGCTSTAAYRAFYRSLQPVAGTDHGAGTAGAAITVGGSAGHAAAGTRR